MKQFLYPFLFGLLIFNVVQLSAQSRRLQTTKEPVWITANTIDYTNASLDNEAEDGYIDLAFEQQVSLDLQTVYYKKAYKIISEAGIQNRSELSIDFDPSHEQLTFHKLIIFRDGKVINKLDASKFKIIQQETELSRSVYNGALSAVLFLEDVRKGDAIEYAYSIKGFNPIFKGKYAAHFDVAFGVPVYSLYYKIISDTGRHLQIKNSLTTAEPTVTNNAKKKIYEWRFNNVNALHLQDYVPSWYDVYPMIMVSEYKSWKEVNDWAKALFPAGIPLSTLLKKKIEELRATSVTDEGRVMAALRFVQDDVRYMGIEMGENSHKPNNPNKIFDQRFGDCKDKSYLLCTLLRGLGIEADPVLINTYYKKTIFNWLPSYYDFDHCTVRINLNDRNHFLDPTIAYQRGGINDISFPDYQCGLVITDTTTTLTPIAIQETGKVKTKEIFTIPDMNGKASLVVTTQYTGTFADDMRDDFKSNSMYEMQKNFLKFYSNYYPEITVADSLKIEDDESTGKFTTNEFYNIDNFWSIKDGAKKVSFYAYTINSILLKPKELSRTMPFRIAYPSNYKEEIEINLPEKWSIEESHENITCPGFTLKADFTYSNRKVFLNYDYNALKDHATPAEAKEVLDACKKFDDELGFGLSYNIGKNKNNSIGKSYDTAPSSTDNKIMYVIVSVLVVVIAIVYRTQRRA